MTAVATPHQVRPSSRGARRRRWVPPQHGAWAMLLVPYLAGLVAVGLAWPDLSLLVAWLGGYLLSYYALLAVKTRRPGRVRGQLAVYGGVTVAAALMTLAARPRLMLFAPLFVAILGLNAVFARHHDDRALVNGLASVVAACLAVPMTAVVAGVPVGAVGDAFALCLLFFTGSLLFVKTVFRERENVRLRRASVAYHVVAVVLAGALSPAYVPAFVFYLVRAVALGGRKLKPGRAGVVEIVSSVLLLVTIGVAG